MSCITEKLGLESIRNTDNAEVPFDLVEEEEIRFRAAAVDLILSTNNQYGRGTLYLTTKRVVWMKDDAPSNGYGVNYFSIVVHAIGGDVSLHDGRPCIYLQLEPPDPIETDEEESFQAVMTLLPEERSQLEEIFQVLCDCAALNPDPEDESDSGFHWGGMENPEQQDLEELLGNDPERFEDPEEDDDPNSL